MPNLELTYNEEIFTALQHSAYVIGLIQFIVGTAAMLLFLRVLVWTVKACGAGKNDGYPMAVVVNILFVVGSFIAAADGIRTMLTSDAIAWIRYIEMFGG